jgi:alpha-tubulin suppressor-like RCC1 family protein
MASLSGISLWSTPIAQSAYASASAFTCVVGTNGQVKCFGQAGANETTSTPFYGVFGYCWARSAHNSAAQSCAANSSFTPSSSLGYLASDMGSALLPVDLNGVAAKQLSVGKYFVCAMGADYSVRCFGLNTDGQLGAGIATNVGTNASEMGANLRVALSSAAGIGSGYEHTCAALQNNTVKCWGSSTLNATGLASIGVAGDSGINSAASALTAVYDGR